jgi:diaminopimelate decarboxylase
MGKPTMYLEPGRYLVGDAAVLLTSVNSVKQSYRKFIVVDAGFNTLLRPAMYDSYHHIVIANKMREEASQKVDIAGNVCESGDLFGRDRLIGDVDEGDILAILNAGAYGFTMASNYNSRPKTSEVLVSNGESYLVRQRETFDDLLDKQIIPDHLQ